MNVVTIGEVCKVVSGSTPKREIAEYWGGTIPWVTPKEISRLDSPYLWDSVEKITPAGFRSSSTTMLPAGSLLLSSRAPIGLLAINKISVCTNQGFKSLVPGKEVNVEYLYYVLKANVSSLQAKGNGATFKELAKPAVENFKIPLPPLDDQIRIAHLLGKVEGLIAQRKQHLQQLNDLLNSVFLDMFGDPVRNEKGWSTRALTELCMKITDGEHLNPQFSLSGMPMVMAGNVLDHEVSFRDAKYVEYSVGELFRKKCNPELSDILLVSRGATIGRLCRVDTSQPFCLMGSVILLKPKHQLVNSSFLVAQLKHPALYLKLFKSSGASAQQAIYLKDVKRLTCILPPMERQTKFSAFSEKVELTKESYQHSLRELEVLYATLSQKAFKGKLDLSLIDLSNKKIQPQNSEEDQQFFNNEKNVESHFLATLEGRAKLLRQMFDEAIHALPKGAEFDVDLFWINALTDSMDLIDENSEPFGMAEYEQFKRWIFEMLRSNQLEQRYDEFFGLVLSKSAK